MNSIQFAQLFPLGSHLCREPMPAMSELKRDMENLQRHGFNLIKLQEHWAIDEPCEGQYDFSRYEELIAHAATLDMGIYLGLTCEQAPAWLWRKHPGCRMVGINGQPIAYEAQMTLPADGKPGPCYDHPGAMVDQLRFIHNLVATLGRYENVVVWNTWQEISYWAEGLVGTPVCFCQHTLAHFRRWLQQTHGDLDSLNVAWNTRYCVWEDVLPNQGSGVRGPYAMDIAWNYFMANIQISNVLTARAAAIRAADPLKRPVFAHKGGPDIGYGHDWQYARCQDFLGCSNYPAWGSIHGWDDGRPESGHPFDRHRALQAEMYNLALNSDYIRSANRSGAPVWAAEFQGGPVSTGLHKGRVPLAEDIRRWMLTSISSGITALSFWVTRAEVSAGEINGFSLLDSQGDTTPRFAEAARVGNALSKYPELFGQPTLAAAEVAIVVDEWTAQSLSLLGDNPMGHLSYSLRGWHRMLWEAGIPVDFVALNIDDVDLSQYRVLIFPFPWALSEESAAKLAAYVAQGGQLICEAAPGRIDTEGFCPRGELSPTMRKLFGVTQQSLTMVREPEFGTRWMPGERTWSEYLDATMAQGVGALVGQSLRANLYLETFVPVECEPCLMVDDKVVGVVRTVGAGKAWLLGTYVGHSVTAYRSLETIQCMLAVLAQGGIVPDNHGGLLLRKRVSADKEAWLFTNATDHAITAQVDVTGWANVQDLLDAPLQSDGKVVKLTVESLDVQGLIVTR